MKGKKKIALAILLFFSFTLLPAAPASAAATLKTEMTEMYFGDSDGMETTDVGKAIQLILVFKTTADNEKPVISLDKRIEPLPLSLQPEAEKIEKIVGSKVTLKPGISEKTVKIRFVNALTEAGDYQMPIRIGSTVINPNGVQYLTLYPGPAVMINPSYASAEEKNQPPHTTFDCELKLADPIYTADKENITGYKFSGVVTLQLRDKYDNRTARLPEGKKLVIRFEPRSGKNIEEYTISALSDGQKITRDFAEVTEIPTDKHVLGAIEFSVKTQEEANSDTSTITSVPKLHAAFANADGLPEDSLGIDEKTELISDLGFIPKTTVKGNDAVLSVNGTIRVGSNNNQFVFTIDGIYPAAGRKLKLTMPKGYVAAETNKNYIYFDYDDIGKSKIVDLNAIPKKISTSMKVDEKTFVITVDPEAKPKDEISYQVINEGLVTYAAGLADSAKSKLILGKTKKVPANSSDYIEAALQLKDVNSNATYEIADDYHIFIWAEREAGKVSTTEQIVSVPDGVKISSTAGKDNGHEGVYEVTDFIPESCEVPFGITSNLDGKATIKAAIAPDAYSALLYQTKDDGLVSNTVKVSFDPYASSNTWVFSNVKTSGIKAADLASKGNYYQVLRTKKSNGADKFSVSARLDSEKGNVKLPDEPVSITCTNSKVNITTTAKTETSKLTDGIRVETDKSGNIKFDVTATENGSYTINVKTDGGDASFTIKLPYDDTGGNEVDTDDADDSLDARLKAVAKVVVDNQSTELLAKGDTLYARFKLYDKDGKEVLIKNDEEAEKAIRTLKLTKPQGSELEDGKNKDIDISSSDGGILLEFPADKLGKFGITMTITNNKSGKASFNVDQNKRIVGLRLEYDDLGLNLGERSGKGTVVFIDNDGVETRKTIPVKGIEVSASGKALEDFDETTGIVKVRKGDDNSGSVITVTALDRSHNLEATHRFVIGHDVLPLEFSNTEGYVHQTLRMTTKISDEANRALPLGALSPKAGAQMSVTVLSKPANAIVKTELEDNGASFSQNGMNVLKVKSDRIGKVQLRVDIRAVDPNYSTKYPIYTYLSGVVEVNFAYPGILDSKPIMEGYSNGNTTLMYIGSNTYVNRGKVAYMDTPPFIQNERTFIPVRALGDSLNASTYYNDGNQSIMIYGNDGNRIQMQIGSPIITTSNQGTVRSDVVPFIQDGRTFLPLRVVAEMFGCQVDAIYDDDEVVGVVFAQQ